MVMCYCIQKQPLRVALERRCFEICIQSTWHMPADGFLCTVVAVYQPAALVEANFLMGVFQWFWLLISPCGFRYTYFLERLSSRTALMTVSVYFCLSKVSLIQLKIIVNYSFICFAQPKIVIMAYVAAFYINGHTSLLLNIFQIKIAEAHLEAWWASELELFAKTVNCLKPLITFAKSSTLDVLNGSLNWS